MKKVYEQMPECILYNMMHNIKENLLKLLLDQEFFIANDWKL